MTIGHLGPAGLAGLLDLHAGAGTHLTLCRMVRTFRAKGAGKPARPDHGAIWTRAQMLSHECSRKRLLMAGDDEENDPMGRFDFR